MKEKYKKYISQEFLQHCMHSFDTQINEGLNNSVSAFANKGKHYGSTTSLITRVSIAAGIHLVGYHHFWTSCLTELEVQIPLQLELRLLSMDKEKVARYHRDHEYETKVKRKRLEHEKFKNEFIAHQKDIQRNATYDPRTGCAIAPQKESLCVHAQFGCKGKNGHKTERSKQCDYHISKRGGLSIVAAQADWRVRNEKINNSGVGEFNMCFFSAKFIIFYYTNQVFV